MEAIGPVTVPVGDQQRRRRLIERHHLGRSATDPTSVVAAVAALHSTDPTTPYLSVRARVSGFEIGHLDRELFDTRSLWRMHTIRRTLFIVGEADVPVFEAGATRDIARKERARLVGWLSPEMEPSLIEPWLEELSEKVIGALQDSELATREVSELVPELTTEMTVGSGRWVTRLPLSSRLLFILAMEGRIVRTRPAGTWRSSQYRWAAARDWFPEPIPVVDESDGRSLLARRYLATHGPVTMTDLRWWTGWTLKSSREALSGLDFEEVDLESGGRGMVLAGDTDEAPDPGPTVAFLPSLDSTIMGWKERDWYLGSYSGDLFDTNGNAGPTVWVDGRVVGGWAQDPGGSVVFELLEEVPSAITARLGDEAAELTDWLGGEVVMPRFPSPMGRRLSRW